MRGSGGVVQFVKRLILQDWLVEVVDEHPHVFFVAVC